MSTLKKSWFLFLILGYFLLNSGEVPTEKYMVEKPDGSVSIVYYVIGSKDSLFDVLKSQGMENLPVSRVKDSDIPSDRKDRKYWRRGALKKIEVDEQAKASDAQKEVDILRGPHV